MFCCGVCSVMFNGIYPESVLTTLCGHLFHSECILQCLKKSLKCPFCTLNVEKRELIKLNFQLDTSWKETAAALKTKANTSVICLDDSMNETIIDLPLLGNLSLIEIDDDESMSEVRHELLVSSLCNQVENSVYNTKTLLTTALSGIKRDINLSKTVDLLLIFKDIIPNSTIMRRQLISENTLVQTAIDQRYTNILIISMHLGNPVGLTFFDLLTPCRTYVAFSSFECFKYDTIKDKIKKQLTVTNNSRYLNEPQEPIVTFFSKIHPKQSALKYDNAKEINFSYCHDCQAVKFELSLAGLHFCMMSPHD